jgi:nucleoside-diphosphate-sugar epimerase
MHVSIVRPTLVYGPGVKGNLALMQLGIEKGWFPPLPEVGNRRSMIHVDDLVQVLLLAANDDRANGEIFIATDGVPHSSANIYEAICHVLGKAVPRWNRTKENLRGSMVRPSMRRS